MMANASVRDQLCSEDNFQKVSKVEPKLIAEVGQSLFGHRVAGWKTYYDAHRPAPFHRHHYPRGGVEAAGAATTNIRNTPEGTTNGTHHDASVSDVMDATLAGASLQVSDTLMMRLDGDLSACDILYRNEGAVSQELSLSTMLWLTSQLCSAMRNTWSRHHQHVLKDGNGISNKCVGNSHVSDGCTCVTGVLPPPPTTAAGAHEQHGARISAFGAPMAAAADSDQNDVAKTSATPATAWSRFADQQPAHQHQQQLLYLSQRVAMINRQQLRLAAMSAPLCRKRQRTLDGTHADRAHDAHGDDDDYSGPDVGAAVVPRLVLKITTADVLTSPPMLP